MSISIELSRQLQEIALELDQRIEAVAGERIGFTLLIYTEGRASYISNVDRAVAIRELKRLLALWEQNMPDIPAHEYRG